MPRLRGEQVKGRKPRPVPRTAPVKAAMYYKAAQSLRKVLEIPLTCDGARRIPARRATDWVRLSPGAQHDEKSEQVLSIIDLSYISHRLPTILLPCPFVPRGGSRTRHTPSIFAPRLALTRPSSLAPSQPLRFPCQHSRILCPYIPFITPLYSSLVPLHPPWPIPDDNHSYARPAHPAYPENLNLSAPSCPSPSRGATFLLR